MLRLLVVAFNRSTIAICGRDSSYTAEESRRFGRIDLDKHVEDMIERAQNALQQDSKGIGETGLEPATSRPPAVRSTKLSYSPIRTLYCNTISCVRQINSGNIV